MKDLIERLEKATGPDRELDVRIHLALFPDFGAKMNDEYVRFENVWNRNRADHQNHADNVADWWGVPRYTGSLDAAMTLVPERHVLDHVCEHWRADDGGAWKTGGATAKLVTANARKIQAEGATVILAVVLVCLKSRSLPDTEVEK